MLLYSYYQINYPDWKIIHLIYTYSSGTLIVKPDSTFCVLFNILNSIKNFDIYISMLPSLYYCGIIELFLIIFVAIYNFLKENILCVKSCCIISINIKVKYKLALRISLKSVEYSVDDFIFFAK